MRYYYIDVKRGLSPPVVELLNILRNKGFIAGGTALYYASSRIDETEPSDIDVYLKEKEFFPSLVSQLERKGWNKKGERLFNIKYVKKFGNNDYNLDLVKPSKDYYGPRVWYGSPKRVIDKADLTITMAAFDYTSISKKKILVSEDFLNDCATHSLRINYFQCPKSMIKRLKLYYLKGYRISIFEVCRILKHYVWHPIYYLNFCMESLRSHIKYKGLNNKD